MAEILDIVDEDDNVVATLSRDEAYRRGLKYVRTADAFIRNSQGQLWIPVRKLDKKIAPGGFDIGAAGHVEHGEDYRDALARESWKSLGGILSGSLSDRLENMDRAMG